MASDFELSGPDGETVRLSDFQGQPVAVTFMHTWWAACNASAPEFRKAYEKYQDQGFEVLSISIQEGDAEVIDFIDRYGLTYPFMIDRTGAVTADYEVSGTPTTYFIAPDGTIVDELPGVVSQRWLEGNLENYIDVDRS
jgi:peroxiredoxin